MTAMTTRSLVPFVAACLAATVYANEATHTNTTDDLILQELRGIRASLDRIADELAKQPATEESVTTNRLFAFDRASLTRRGPDTEKLHNLSLPENASAEGVESQSIRRRLQPSLHGHRGRPVWPP